MKSGGNMNISILVIEDSSLVHAAIAAALEGDCRLHFVETLREARQALEEKEFDIVLVDVKLPDGNGLDFLRTSSHSLFSRVRGVVFLTGMEGIDEKVAAFELGACDYITKPFDPRELQARLRALIARLPANQEKPQSPAPAVSLFAQGLSFNESVQTVAWSALGREHAVSLTSLEFRILRYLVKCSPLPVSRHAILAAVWGNGVSVAPRVIDTHLSHARRKIAGSGFTISNQKGQGFLLMQTKDSEEIPLVDETLLRSWLSDAYPTQANMAVLERLREMVPGLLEPLGAYARQECENHKDGTSEFARLRENALGSLHKLKSAVGQVGAARLAARLRQCEAALHPSESMSLNRDASVVETHLTQDALLTLWHETDQALESLIISTPQRVPTH
jgi:DNA-binding response OmpR family regulator